MTEILMLAAGVALFGAGWFVGHTRGFAVGVALCKPVSATARTIAAELPHTKANERAVPHAVPPGAESEQDKRAREILQSIEVYDGRKV